MGVHAQYLGVARASDWGPCAAGKTHDPRGMGEEPPRGLLPRVWSVYLPPPQHEEELSRNAEPLAPPTPTARPPAPAAPAFLGDLQAQQAAEHRAATPASTWPPGHGSLLHAQAVSEVP